MIVEYLHLRFFKCSLLEVDKIKSLFNEDY